MNEQAPILEAREVTKRFPGVLALDRVSFQLLPGEVHALVGENGAGKSTLIKVITGVYAPDEGQVLFGGEEVSFASPRDSQAAGISTIYQEINLIPMRSVAQNVFLGRELRTRFGLLDSERMNREAAEILGRYGIQADVTAPLNSLGLGTQQMVAIARAVSLEARVVIMDEPTSALEAREVATLFRVIRRLRDDGVGVIYVSHHLDELHEICERVTVLRARGPTRRHVLEDITFDVRPGEIVGLAGLLGAGRSETARAIFGAQPLDSGEVTMAGKQVKTGSPPSAIKAGIAFLPEDRRSEGIIPGLSVRENIVAAAMPQLSRAGLVSEKAQNELVERFMERLGIKASSPDQPVGELSGGNQQKVMLARLLCLNPKVLILDEPTRGIDVGAKAEVQRLIDELARDGLAVVLISSDLEELVEGADRVVVLRAGAVVGELVGDDITEQAIMANLAAGEPTAAEERVGGEAA